MEVAVGSWLIHRQEEGHGNTGKEEGNGGKAVAKESDLSVKRHDAPRRLEVSLIGN